VVPKPSPITVNGRIALKFIAKLPVVSISLPKIKQLVNGLAVVLLGEPVAIANTCFKGVDFLLPKFTSTDKSRHERKMKGWIE
jgi:hypothetical protein